ncbi:MAG: 8-oxo-dGTP diphosphatase [Candidatus Marinimicrobia bacterium]|nr:8-oxo-dGTP diphosphatase [Candidatus Neomarinimicrobiota bacterium]
MNKLATLCYIRDGEKTLMLHRNKKANDMHEGKWNGLGGKVEEGESPEACAIREVMEESGLKVSSPQLKGFITFPHFDGENDWYVFVYRFETFSGELIDSPEGHLQWIPKAQMKYLPLWEGDRIFMDWLDQPGIFSAVFKYETGKLLNWNVTWY